MKKKTAQMRKPILALAVLLAITLIATACGSSSKYAETQAATPQAAPSYEAYDSSYDYAMNEAGAYESPAEPAASAEPAEIDVSEKYGGRKLIRNYELNISTDSFDEHLAGILARLDEFGGYALNSSVSGTKPVAYGDSGRYANLVLRVPADKAEEFITGVKAYGEVNYTRDYTDDVTDDYFDVDTRLGILKDELTRLQSILVTTDNLADIIALEERISNVMREIEELTGTLRRYDALIDYATVNISLEENMLHSGPAAKKTTGERISEGFSDSLYGLGTFFTDFAVWFVSSLPVLLVLAAIATGIFFIIRAIVRASRKRKAKRIAAMQQNPAYMRPPQYPPMQNAPYAPYQGMPQQNAKPNGNAAPDADKKDENK